MKVGLYLNLYTWKYGGVCVCYSYSIYRLSRWQSFIIFCWIRCSRSVQSDSPWRWMKYSFEFHAKDPSGSSSSWNILNEQNLFVVPLGGPTHTNEAIPEPLSLSKRFTPQLTSFAHPLRKEYKQDQQVGYVGFPDIAIGPRSSWVVVEHKIRKTRWRKFGKKWTGHWVDLPNWKKTSYS